MEYPIKKMYLYINICIYKFRNSLGMQLNNIPKAPPHSHRAAGLKKFNKQTARGM